MVEVRLRAVRVDLQSNTPVLLLQESEGLGRTLPIFIGAPEATAIAFALQGMDTPRPMTHDLIRDLLDALGADVIRVVITERKTATYFAEIVPPRGAGDPGFVPALGRGGGGGPDRGAALRRRRLDGQRGDHAGGG
jgi:bifunctional DNase/RNase